MEIYRVTTTASRNKGQVRYGTRFRAMRIWQANRDQPGNEVTVEVIKGEFRDVTAEWRAGNYDEAESAEQEGSEDSSAAAVSGDVSGLPNGASVSGTGWPE